VLECWTKRAVWPSEVDALRKKIEQLQKKAVESDAPDQLVKGYRIKHADGEAAVALLRSLFLVVNHRIAYARFGYDACQLPTHSAGEGRATTNGR
jgi:hypothetical protein